MRIDDVTFFENSTLSLHRIHDSRGRRLVLRAASNTLVPNLPRGCVATGTLRPKFHLLAHSPGRAVTAGRALSVEKRQRSSCGK